MSQMFRARCGACEWVFDVCRLPMPLSRAAKIIGAAPCPMCGNTERNTVAPARSLTDAEREAQTIDHPAPPPSRND